MLRTPIAALITTGTIGVAALAMACGGASQGASANDSAGGNAAQPTQAAVVEKAQPTIASTVAATPTAAAVVAPTVAPAEQPAPVATAANVAPPPPPPPPAPSTLTIDMRDNVFAIPQMRVVAGTSITMTVHNEGNNMHNWDLQGVAKTPLQKAGEYQAVTFTVQPGTYTFVCDVHPKEMTGTLVAE